MNSEEASEKRKTNNSIERIFSLRTPDYDHYSLYGAIEAIEGLFGNKRRDASDQLMTLLGYVTLKLL